MASLNRIEYIYAIYRDIYLSVSY